MEAPRRRPHPRLASSELGVEAKDGALGVSSRSSERASLAPFIAQDPHRNPAGSSRHPKQSRLFGARTQAELLTLLFLQPPRRASDQMPSVLEPRAGARAPECGLRAVCSKTSTEFEVGAITTGFGRTLNGLLCVAAQLVRWTRAPGVMRGSQCVLCLSSHDRPAGHLSEHTQRCSVGSPGPDPHPDSLPL